MFQVNEKKWIEQVKYRFPGINVVSVSLNHGLVVARAIEYGRAARRNRGNYSGQKTHRLWVDYKVALMEDADVDTLGMLHWFNEPVVWSVEPCCMCTQGQFAGQPVEGKTDADVNCSKCKPENK